MRRRSWFHLSFCQGWTTATLCWRVSRKTGWFRLQRVQNNAARLVLGKRGRDLANPSLRSLHWMPGRARIEYKISTLCYRSRDSAYLCDLSVYPPSRSLRSADSGLMTIPRIKLKKYGKRASSHTGPVTCNSLPKPLRDALSLPSFKSNLKTFLFKKHLYWRLLQSNPPGCWAKLTFSCVFV